MKISERDFLRRLPGASRSFARRERLEQRLHIDFILLLLLLAISAIGMVVLYSASSESRESMTRQSIFFGLAYLVMIIVAQVPVDFMRRMAPWAYAGGVVLLILVLVVGVGAKGAQRWLSLGGFRFQPAEVMKLAMPMTMAAYLGTRFMPPRFKHVFFSALLVAIPTALIIDQPDLGTSILVAASGFVVLFFAGLHWRYLFAAVFVLGASLWPIWHFMMHDYQRTRVLTLLNPEADRLGAGWNIIQSKTAIGSGGFYGKGWLEGTQSRLDFLPEGHTDFIIAVMAEEFGFVGVLVLLAMYLLLIVRCMMIAVRAQDAFGRLMVSGITMTFFTYIFVNMGMVSGLLPVVGVPLPLISQGGTAVVTLMAGFGIIMAVATQPKRVMTPQ